MKAGASLLLLALMAASRRFVISHYQRRSRICLRTRGRLVLWWMEESLPTPRLGLADLAFVSRWDRDAVCGPLGRSAVAAQGCD